MEKRKEKLAGAFIDFAKIVFASLVVGNFVSKSLSAVASFVALCFVVIILAVAWFVIPLERKSGKETLDGSCNNGRSND